MSAISVLLTVYDKALALPAVLDALLAQDPAEIIAVDDASTDGSAALLRDRAAGDGRIRLIENAVNRGPAIRLNQAARAARGDWLHLIDADDLPAPDALSWMRRQLEQSGQTLIWGRRVHAGAAPPAAGADIRRVADALTFCARRPVVHMAGMAARATYMAAGGADERVFIQDQSLPLRLAAQAGEMLWTDAPLCAAPPQEGTRLSRNRIQQNHDRFLAARGALDLCPPGGAADRALRALAASARFKLERETGGRRLSTALAYAASKLGHPPSRAALARVDLGAMDGVRRSE